MKKFSGTRISFHFLDKLSNTVYIIKKLLVFLMIYGISAILGEAVIIGIFYAMGYDPLHGIMPADRVAALFSYYGFSVFLLVTILFCKFVEKDLDSLGFQNRIRDYLTGGFLAIILLMSIIGLCCFSGAISWMGISRNSDKLYLFALLAGFAIQSAAEETMCRGFLLQSLLRRTSAKIAIFTSSTAFALPHLPSLLETGPKYAVFGIINLYLISVILSLLVLRRSNLWIACGLHGIWNYILSGIMGLSLSGKGHISDGMIKFQINSENILNGGIYGIEASIMTTVILAIATILLAANFQGRRNKHGIS